MASNPQQPANKPGTTAPAAKAGAPGSGPAAPTAPAAPAQTAVKAAKRKGPDTSKLTPEQKAAFEAAMAKAKETAKEAQSLQRKALTDAGLSVPKSARAATPTYGGFNPDAKVTLVDGDVTGFASDDDKAIKAKIPATGISLKDLLALDNTSYGWFISRLSRNSFKVNGLSMAEAFNKGQSVAGQSKAA